MNSTLNNLLEANLFLVLAALIYFVLVNGDRNLHWRRFYVLGVLLLAPFIPMLEWPTVQLGNQIELTSYVLPEVVLGDQIKQTSNSISWINLMSIGYMGIVAWLIIRLIVRLVRVYKIFSAAELLHNTETNMIYYTTNEFLPTFSFFGKILLNEKGLSPSERNNILAHEQTHVRQWHSIDIIFIELISIIFWYNPVVWMLQKAQRENHEYLADAEVLKSSDLKNYQETLVRMTIDNMSIVGSQFAKIETLKRIDMMNKMKKGTPLYRSILSALAMLLVIVGFACSQGIDSSESELVDEITAANQESVDQIYEIVDEIPMPVEGIEGFYGYIMQNMLYPKQAREQGVEGKVIIEFVINNKGEMTSTKVLEGLTEDCNNEAIRVIKQAGQWKPGIKDGRAVNTKMVMPITFKLKNSDKTIGEVNKVNGEKMDEVVLVGHGK